MKRTEKYLKEYQFLSCVFKAAIVVAVVTFLAVAGASDAGTLNDADLYRSLFTTISGFATAYMGKNICDKNIAALESRLERYADRENKIDTFDMSYGMRKAHFQGSVGKRENTVRTGRVLCRRSVESDAMHDAIEDWLMLSGLPSISDGGNIWFSDDHHTWKKVDRAVEGNDVVLYESIPETQVEYA